MNKTAELKTLHIMIRDKKTMDIIRELTKGFFRTETLVKTCKLTRKQYYSRMDNLKRAGVVMKGEHRKYIITAYGNVLIEYINQLKNLEKNQYRFHVMDVMAQDKKVPFEEIAKVRDTIFKDFPLNKELLTVRKIK